MHLFCLSAAPFWTTKHYVQVSRNESLSYTQSESTGRNLAHSVTTISTYVVVVVVVVVVGLLVTVFKRLSVNITDLCRNSLAEQD